LHAQANPSGYCQYNLMALVQNADQAKNSGSEVNLWEYVGAKDGSIRAVVDWLLPYATGAVKWPYEQNSEQPSWSSMFPVLRAASIAFQNKSYEEAACKVVQHEELRIQASSSTSSHLHARDKQRPPDSSDIVWPVGSRPPLHVAHAPLGGGAVAKAGTEVRLDATNYVTDQLNLLSPPSFIIDCPGAPPHALVLV